jgi:hypothetical protein
MTDVQWHNPTTLALEDAFDSLRSMAATARRPPIGRGNGERRAKTGTVVRPLNRWQSIRLLWYHPPQSHLQEYPQ